MKLFFMKKLTTKSGNQGKFLRVSKEWHSDGFGDCSIISVWKVWQVIEVSCVSALIEKLAVSPGSLRQRLT